MADSGGNTAAPRQDVPQRPIRTRLKDGIRQVKEYNDGTVRYAGATTIDPTNHLDVLEDANSR